MKSAQLKFQRVHHLDSAWVLGITIQLNSETKEVRIVPLVQLNSALVYKFYPLRFLLSLNALSFEMQ